MEKKRMSVEARHEVRQNIGKINENRGKLESLRETLIRENRGMTDEEREQERQWVSENEQLALRNETLRQPVYEADDVAMSKEDAFESIVRSLSRDERVQDKYAYLRNQKGEYVLPVNLMDADKQFRAVQDSASVEPTTPVTIKDLIKPLENALIFDKVGTHIQYGIQGVWNFPILNSAVEADWLAENAEAQDKVLTFSKKSPVPKRIAISIPVSNFAINQSAGMISGIVSEQIQKALVRSLNKAFFATSTAPGAPDGVFKDVVAGSIAAGKEWAGLLALKGTVANANVENDGTACYVMNEATYWKLAATPRDAGSGLMCAENYLINGTPVYTTGEMAADTIGYGYFGYMLLGFFGNVTLGADSTSAAVRKVDETVYVLNAHVDYLRLRKEAFAVSKLAAAGK